MHLKSWYKFAVKCIQHSDHLGDGHIKEHFLIHAAARFRKKIGGGERLLSVTFQTSFCGNFDFLGN